MAAVPPVVANPMAQDFLNALAADNVHDPPDQRYKQATKRYRISKTLFSTDSITSNELHEHSVFRDHCAAAANGDIAGGGVPSWFGPALAAGLAAALAPVNDRLNRLNDRLDLVETKLANGFDRVEARIGNVETSLGIVQARQLNSVAVLDEDVLRPFPNAEGIAAPNFPQSIEELDGMTDDEMEDFLIHYHLPEHGDDFEMRDRIKKFIGICVPL